MAWIIKPARLCSRRKFQRCFTTLSTKEILRYAYKSQTPLSLKQMFEFGSHPSAALLSTQFVHKEVPIRLARLIIHCDNFPYGLSHQEHVQAVRKLYLELLERILSIPYPENESEGRQMNNVLSETMKTLVNIAPYLSRGIHVLKMDESSEEETRSLFLTEFMNRFFVGRIGSRVLLEQHLAMCTASTSSDIVGLIYKHCNISEVASEAVEQANDICYETYQKKVEVEIHDKTTTTFQYMPHNLRLILFQLLKNSMRAVVEFHEDLPENELPPVQIVIVHGEENITIKVSDRGGGVPRHQMNILWAYGYSTAPTPNQPLLDLAIDQPVEVKIPMAGVGVGLPLARLHARYFGGDLELLSMHGYGTDAFVILPQLGDVEIFPLEYNLREAKWN